MASPTSPINPNFPVLKKRLGGEEYAIEAELAKGAVWRVFKGERLSDSKYVAVKETIDCNIRHEIDILTRCVGKWNIVNILKTCRDDDATNKSPLYTYLITELCSTDLHTFMRDMAKPFPRDQLPIAAKHLADGYNALASNGVLHKNISSKNILVYFIGNQATLKISGFNCAVVIKDNPFKRSYTITGRVQYMAPEIGRYFIRSKRSTAEYTAKSDMWSLGVLLYEIALAKFPFSSSELLDIFKSAVTNRSEPPIKFDDLETPEMACYCLLIRRLLRVNVQERLDTGDFCTDQCFAHIQPNSAIYINDKDINDAMRIYDLAWTLPASISLIRVRDYEYNEAVQLGKGSFGKVWRAKRISDHTKVALKRVHREDIDLAEIETMQTVVHPNLLKLIDHFEQYPFIYIITQLCNYDLASFLKSKFPGEKFHDESEARILSRHLSSGYMAMKSAEIMHRDIKPSNVLVSMDPDGGALFKLADFGCSKAMTHVEYAQTILGTPFYMAPELGACLYLQIDTAHYDHRADIWSMGLIVFQCLLGRLPFGEGDLLRMCYDVGTGQSTEYYQNEMLLHMEMINAGQELRDMLIKALSADYNRRLTATDFFQHNFHSHLPLSTRMHVNGVK